MLMKLIFKSIAIMLICSKSCLSSDELLKKCPRNDDPNELITIYKSLVKDGKYKTFLPIDSNTRESLTKNPLPTRVAGVGGKVSFTSGMSIATKKCCYQYAPQKRKAIASAARTLKDADCPANRICFCIIPPKRPSISIEDYKIMELSPGRKYTQEEIIKQYRIRSMKIHPDKHTENKAFYTEQFKKLGNAKERMLKSVN